MNDATTLRELYDALSVEPMTLREVAQRHYHGDCLTARDQLEALQRRDLIEVAATLQGVSPSFNEPRRWTVLDPK